jgi:hypothetical protein
MKIAGIQLKIPLQQETKEFENSIIENMIENFLGNSDKFFNKLFDYIQEKSTEIKKEDLKKINENISDIKKNHSKKFLIYKEKFYELKIKSIINYIVKHKADFDDLEMLRETFGEKEITYMKKKILGTIEKEYPEKAKEIYRERIK